MKKLLILIVGAIMMTSCNTASNGAFSGAMFGGVIGSCIGGINGGPRGSDVGTLVGMMAGAATGAAIGSAVESQQTRAYYALPPEEIRDGNRGITYDDQSGRSEKPVYDDVIQMDKKSVDINEIQTPRYDTDIRIENVRFVNDANTQHISKGELVKISFEVCNVSDSVTLNIVPMVKETTDNKRILVSPATMIENLGAHKAIRYTAFVSAQKNLKTGTAHFQISVMSGTEVISNIVEFDIPLE